MTLKQLRIKLSKYGAVQICKEGVVFTLMITGTGLSKLPVFNEIFKNVTQYTCEKYPFVEAMVNTETYFLIVLKPNR